MILKCKRFLEVINHDTRLDAMTNLSQFCSIVFDYFIQLDAVHASAMCTYRF